MKKTLLAIAMLGTFGGAMAQGLLNFGTDANAPSAPQVQPPITSSGKDTKMTLREINQKRAELELLKIEAELLKAREPFELVKEKQAAKLKAEEEAKNQALAAQVLAESAARAATESSKNGNNAASTSTNTGSTEVAQAAAPVVSVLSIYGLADNLTATVKVNDMVLNVKKGDRLPEGFIVRSVGPEFVEMARSNRGKADRLYVSGSDAAAIYSARRQAAAAANPQPVVAAQNGVTNTVGAVGTPMNRSAAIVGANAVPAVGLPPLPAGSRGR